MKEEPKLDSELQCLKTSPLKNTPINQRNQMSFLRGKTFSLELGVNFRFKNKQEIIKTIQKYGGHVSFILTATVRLTRKEIGVISSTKPFSFSSMD